MGDWGEIRRLAADLQRVQLGEASKKLSDHNVVEVVQKLVDLGLVSLIYTIDGREYVTRQHLITQIKNECLGKGGRVSLVDLSQSLNIDYQQIETRVNEIVKNDHNFILSIGQLISRSYLDSICQEVNMKLQDEGTLNISNVTKTFDLPSDLVAGEIRSSLGKKIEGFLDHDDPGLLYTEGFVDQQKAIIRGALTGMTKMTPVRKILNDLSLQPTLFFRLVDELVEEGSVRGHLTGSRRADSAVFVPKIYTELLASYTNEYFMENGYVEFTQLKKTGVSDCVQYLKEVLSKGDVKNLVVLENGALGKEAWEKVVSEACRAMANQSWVEVANVLPTDFAGDGDPEAACSLLRKEKKEWKRCGDQLLYGENLVGKCERLLEPMVRTKAEKDSEEVAARLKSGTQAPSKPAEESFETKGSGKKKGGKKNKKEKEPKSSSQDASGSAHQNIEFLSEAELAEILGDEESLRNCPQDILAEISEQIRPALYQKYKEELESIFVRSRANAVSSQKRSHADFAEKFYQLYSNICMFDAGTEIFDDSTSAQLRVYLLKSLGTEICNLALTYISGTPNGDQISQKVIDSTIQSLESAEGRESFKNLYASLASKEGMEPFYDALYDVAGPSLCSLKLKTPDKQTRKELLVLHQNELKKQLEKSEEPASGLLLSLLLLLTTNFDVAIHASGKFVPQISSMVQKNIDADLASLIVEVQSLVVKSMKKGGGVNPEDLHEKFDELRKKICEQS